MASRLRIHDPGITEYDLQQLLAVAIHNTPGIHEGNTSPWEVAGKVIDELTKIGIIESKEES